MARKPVSLLRSRIKTRLQLSYMNRYHTIVRSERAAKAWAREVLGVNRLHETPTVNGWQYWASIDPEGNDDPVNVVVII